MSNIEREKIEKQGSLFTSVENLVTQIIDLGYAVDKNKIIDKDAVVGCLHEAEITVLLTNLSQSNNRNLTKAVKNLLHDLKKRHSPNRHIASLELQYNPDTQETNYINITTTFTVDPQDRKTKKVWGNNINIGLNVNKKEVKGHVCIFVGSKNVGLEVQNPYQHQYITKGLSEVLRLREEIIQNLS